MNSHSELTQGELYKSIWLAAGLAYERGSEDTGIWMVEEPRGTIERITPFEGKRYLEKGGKQRRLSRAMMLETTTAYLSQDPDAPDEDGQAERARIVHRRWKFKHLIHQYRTVLPTAVTEVFAHMPILVTSTEVFGEEITNAHALGNFPRNCQKSPFVQLTYASDVDRALEYQPMVVRELARKAIIYDINKVVPQPTYMQDLVRPETSEGYQRDAGWPLASLTIANVTKEQ
eukprot:3613786-Amphidinium_carterae.2